MTLDAWMYGDPERVAIRREEARLAAAKKCGDCVQKLSAVIDGEQLYRCEFKNRIYGIRRCELFRRAK